MPQQTTPKRAFAGSVRKKAQRDHEIGYGVKPKSPSIKRSQAREKILRKEARPKGMD
jgi:hypothetical protein